MTARSLFVFIALGSGLSSAVVASEAEWPTSSAADVSIFATLQRFQIYADHCSAGIPRLKPEFDILVDGLGTRIEGIAKGLLASAVFMGLKDKPVPAEILFSIKDSFDDLRHNFERLDAASVCPGTLQNLAEVDDESLEADLTQILTAVQKMIRNVESEGARWATGARVSGATLPEV